MLSGLIDKESISIITSRLRHLFAPDPYYYLYMMPDVYSRKIVAHEVHEAESAELAALLMRRASLAEGLAGRPLVLHSDNGSPMKGATMLSTLENLGVVASFSRPRLSNDNRYAESLFRTCKCRPDYPRGPFANVDEARAWTQKFVRWYNLNGITSYRGLPCWLRLPEFIAEHAVIFPNFIAVSKLIC
jgi:transposase InsO family protein